MGSVLAYTCEHQSCEPESITAVTLSTICVARGSQRAQIRRGLGNRSNTILLSHLTPFLSSRKQQSVILPQSDPDSPAGPDKWVLLSEVHVSTLSLQQRCSGFIISVMTVWIDTTSKVKASVMIDPDATRATSDSISFLVPLLILNSRMRQCKIFKLIPWVHLLNIEFKSQRL